MLISVGKAPFRFVYIQLLNSQNPWDSTSACCSYEPPRRNSLKQARLWTGAQNRIVSPESKHIASHLLEVWIYSQNSTSAASPSICTGAILSGQSSTSAKIPHHPQWRKWLQAEGLPAVQTGLREWSWSSSAMLHKERLLSAMLVSR